MGAVAAAVRVVPEVPILCPGGTVACIGTGPSLTQADVDFVRGKADRVIAINNAYTFAPWADVLYACDKKWWDWHKGVPSFVGLKFALQDKTDEWPGVQKLKHTGESGLELDRIGLRSGANSGYQAINVAVHLGAATVILLGYDMQDGPNGEKHVHADHPDQSRPPYLRALEHFKALVEPLKARGVRVVNCTRRTALTAFPKMSLEAL